MTLRYNIHRSQLAKTKIDGADNEKKDDSGNETGAGEGEPEEEPEIVHYDKSKSFFDNISCEAVERSKGYVSLRKYLIDIVIMQLNVDTIMTYILQN